MSEHPVPGSSSPSERRLPTLSDSADDTTMTGRLRVFFRVLEFIERIGSLLPHPFWLFWLLTAILACVSAVLAVAGVEVTAPGTEDVTAVRSLLSIDALVMALSTALENFAGFAPPADRRQRDPRRRRGRTLWRARCAPAGDDRSSARPLGDFRRRVRRDDLARDVRCGDHRAVAPARARVQVSAPVSCARDRGGLRFVFGRVQRLTTRHTLRCDPLLAHHAGSAARRSRLRRHAPGELLLGDCVLGDSLHHGDGRRRNRARTAPRTRGRCRR